MPRVKTKFIGLRVEPSLFSFLNYVMKEIAPKDPRNPKNMSELITAILKRFWLEYMLGIAKPSVSVLEKKFIKKYKAEKSKK